MNWSYGCHTNFICDAESQRSLPPLFTSCLPLWCVCVCVCVCVCACVRACACVCVWLSLPPSPFFLCFAFHRVRPLSFAPHPLPRQKLEACIEHFECMIINITVKPNVMFEINFCAARPAISPGKHLLFFSFFLFPPPPFFPPIILCLRFSLLDYIDLYITYFPCVFVCVFFLFYFDSNGHCIYNHVHTEKRF